MRFKVGDKAIIEWCSSLIGVKILNVYSNNQRYKIDQENWKRMVKEGELYETRFEYYQEQYKLTLKEISELQEQKENYQRLIEAEAQPKNNRN